MISKMDPEAFESEYAALLKVLQREKGSCPDAERLLSYHRGDLTESEVASLKKHLLLCGVCSELMERLRQREEAVDDPEWKQVEERLDERNLPWRTSSRSRGTLGNPYRYWLAAAAGLVLAVGVFVVWPTTAPVPISSDPDSVTRGGVLQLEEPAGVVSEVQAFTWNAPPIASSFRLQIRDQGQVIWEATVEESSYRPPAELFSLLLTGKLYEWRVQALDDEGEAVVESFWMPFELSP